MITKGSPILISKQELMSYISQEEMAFRYVQGFQQVGKSFKSEFRDEGVASSRLWWNQYGYLIFKDFGDPNIPDGLTMIQYVSHKYGIDEQSAINKIAQDFKLIGGSSELGKVSKRKKIMREFVETPSNLIIKIKKRDWTEKDIWYWNQYYIPIEMLERNNIKSISHVFYNNTTFPIEFTNTNLSFSYDYYWSAGIFRRKIYQPYSVDYKWRTNCDATIVQNYPNIPKSGKTLFIQSSYKDCMVMERMGFWSVAPNKEGSWFPDYYWEKLKERWKNIIIYWDNDYDKEDNPGLRYAQYYSELYKVPYVINPNDTAKDISDFVKKYGLSDGKELIKGLKLNKNYENIQS